MITVFMEGFHILELHLVPGILIPICTSKMVRFQSNHIIVVAKVKINLELDFSAENKNPIQHYKGKLLSILPTWGKFWQVELDITINSFPGSWANVIHFTNSGSDNTYLGDRNPAIFLNKNKYFHICSGIGTNRNWCMNYLGLKAGTNYRILIQQYPYYHYAYYRIYVNGVYFKGTANGSPKDYSHVYVYTGYNGWETFDGKVENFKFRHW